MGNGLLYCNVRWDHLTCCNTYEGIGEYTKNKDTKLGEEDTVGGRIQANTKSSVMDNDEDGATYGTMNFKDFGNIHRNEMEAARHDGADSSFSITRMLKRNKIPPNLRQRSINRLLDGACDEEYEAYAKLSSCNEDFNDE
eukprot:jgi/Bigna1/135699/aug1.30_g10407